MRSIFGEGEGLTVETSPSPKFASLRSQISTLPQGEGRF
jgi:hypothetical protein